MRGVRGDRGERGERGERGGSVRRITWRGEKRGETSRRILAIGEGRNAYQVPSSNGVLSYRR